MRTREQRSSPRTPLSAQVYVTAGNVCMRAWMLDVSAGGARICGAQLPAAGSRVGLRVLVPSHSVHAQGTVVRAAQLDVGIAFDPLTAAEQLALTNALLEHDLESRQPAPYGAVLVMTELPQFQAALGTALRRSGYQVSARSTPLDALEVLLADAPPLCAVIASAGLPHAGGYDVLDFIAQERPQVRRALVIGRRQRLVARRSIPHVLISTTDHPDLLVRALLPAGDGLGVGGVRGRARSAS